MDEVTDSRAVEILAGVLSDHEAGKLSSDGVVQTLRTQIDRLREPAGVGGEVLAQVYVSDRMEELCPIAGMEPGRIRNLLGNGTHNLYAATKPPAEAQAQGGGEVQAQVGLRAVLCGDAMAAMTAVAEGASFAHAWNELDAKAFRVPRTAPPSAPAGVADPGVKLVIASRTNTAENLAEQQAYVKGWNDCRDAALAQQPAAVGGAYSVPRNRAEAAALARLALAHLGVIDTHIDAAIARCETNSAAQPGGSGHE